MSKVIRTGTIYRMVGFLVAAVIALAIAVPTIAQMMLSQAKQQEEEVASRPIATKLAAPAPVAQPVAAPQAPVVFGAPTMPAAPVDYAKLQQQQAQNQSSTPAQSSAPSTPSYKPSLPESSPDLGVDPNVTAPRVIPPKIAPKPAESARNWRRVAIQ